MNKVIQALTSALIAFIAFQAGAPTPANDGVHPETEGNFVSHVLLDTTQVVAP